MRKESIVPPRPDQILVLPFGPYRFSPPRGPSGRRLPLAAQEGHFGEGGRGNRHLTGQRGNRGRSPAGVTLVGDGSGGEGAF